MAREPGRRRERRVKGGIAQLPWRNYRNPYKPIEVLSADQLEAIHGASLRILEEIGMDFLDDEALAVMKKAGAEVKPGADDQPMQRLQSPATVDKFRGQPVEQFRMRRSRPLHTEVILRFDETSPEELLPNAIDRDSRRERLL